MFLTIRAADLPRARSKPVVRRLLKHHPWQAGVQAVLTQKRRWCWALGSATSPRFAVGTLGGWLASPHTWWRWTGLVWGLYMWEERCITISYSSTALPGSKNTATQAVAVRRMLLGDLFLVYRTQHQNKSPDWSFLGLLYPWMVLGKSRTHQMAFMGKTHTSGERKTKRKARWARDTIPWLLLRGVRLSTGYTQ